jgi:hypothetical protein
MNSKLLRVLSIAIVGAPAAVYAQTTTLDYQGNVGGVVLPSSPLTATYTASITLTGSLAANNLYITSYDVSLSGSNGYSDGSNSGSAGPSSPIFIESPGGTSFCGSLTGSCIDLTTANGAITGASIQIFSSGYHVSTTTFRIGSEGDWYNSQASGTNGGCNIPYIPGTVYTGPTINPCTVSSGNTMAGSWTVTQAPELDGSSALSGMMLLLGGAAVLRGSNRPARRLPLS